MKTGRHSTGKRQNLAQQERDISIRTKLALWTSIPLICLVGGAAAFLATDYAQTFHAQSRRTAVGYLQTLAVPVSRAMAVHALDRVDGYLDEAAHGSAAVMSLLSLAALDDSCNFVARSKPGSVSAVSSSASQAKSSHMPDRTFRQAACKTQVPTWRRHRDDEGILVLDVSMPAVSGLRWGTLIGRFDLSPVEGDVRELLWALFGFTLLLTATMAQALRLALTRLVVEPIDELAENAERITEGHMDARAWVASGDEIGRLAIDFNAMADELQSYTESLERKVEERAAEIQRKNRELERVNAKLTDAVDELERIATTDGLTGVANRRFFDEALRGEFLRAERRKLPFSVVLADVDHFKNYNDTNGHPAGDRALKLLAKTFAEELRATDVLARYGGEEFVALLLDTPKEGAVRVAESLRQAVYAADFEFGAGQPGGRVSTSLGVATFPVDADNPEDLVQSADKALYLAKAAGRNRVIAWGPEAEKAQQALDAASKVKARG